MNEGQAQGGNGAVADKLGSAGWALFIVWIGIAMLTGWASWITLLGIGVITLGIQFLRKSSGLAFEGFWVVVGLLFILAGIWEWSGPTLPLFPVLLILAGLGGLYSLFAGRSS